jgi:hypothetical protein
VPNKTIDELDPAGPLAGTEEVGIWQAGAVPDATVKTTLQDIADLASGVLPGLANQIPYYAASGTTLSPAQHADYREITGGGAALTLGDSASLTPGALALAANSGGHAVISANSTTASTINLDLPPNLGTPGDVLTTNGAGITSWGAAIGVTHTVATLPAAPPAGSRAWVTDATTPAFLAPLVGGGAVVCPAFYDGTNWIAA